MAVARRSCVLWIAGAAIAASSPVEYNEVEALLYLQYARVSFCTSSHVQNWDCGEMCNAAPVQGTPRFFNSTRFGSQGYVARIPSNEDVTCIVSFRGSISVQNWIADFVAYLTPWNQNSSWCPGCEVHAGVAKTYAALRQQMLDAIHALQCQHVAFAGHSLGGALVGLASLDVGASLKLPVGPIYTYGMLRTGNQAFVDAHVRLAESHSNSPPMWRLVHYKDAVPRVPPDYLPFLGYVHTPVEVYYSDRNNTHWQVCPSSGSSENETCSKSISLTSCVSSDPGYDHNMYLNKTTDHDKLPKSCIVDESTLMVV